MGKTHDELASLIGDQLLQNIRKGKLEWKQIFSSDIHRVGDWEWPRPDYILKDSSNCVTYANEFKPPRQTKREYLTGLGQAIAYLKKHDYAGIILPKYSDDGFEIGKYVAEILNSDEFKHLPISLVEYDDDKIETTPDTAIRLLKSIDNQRNSKPISNDKVTDTFWCFWRDTSHYEIYDLLKLSDKFNDEKGDIYTNHIYNEFYQMLITGKTKQWNGTPRNKKESKASKKSEKQNYKIPLFHLGLWSQSEGRLTPKGYKLLVLGKIHGPNGKKFKDFLAYLILIDGKHLELIKEIMLFQKNHNNIPRDSKSFYSELDNYLEEKGFIGKRKPSAVKTGAKQSYIRDEPKLWNSLGLLEMKNKTSYFFGGEGLKFNWNKITELLMEDYEI